MLSLQEIQDITKNYRFKFDFNSKTCTLINSSTKLPITGVEESNKAKVGILLNNMIISGVTPEGGLKLSGVDDKFFGTDDIQLRSEKFLNSLVTDLSKIIQSQHFSINIGSLIGHKTPIEMFAFKYFSSEPHIQDCYLSLFDMVSKDIGYKLDDLQFSQKNANMQVDIDCKSHKINNSPTNPNNANKKLSEQELKARKRFVETLINKYKQLEDDSNYGIRSENEIKTMQRVVEVSKGNIPLTQLPNDKHKFMRMLIAAQNLSIDGEHDFLEEIISIDIVNNKLLQLHSDKNFQKSIDDAITDKKAKNEKLGHKETYAETMNRLANSCVLNHPEEFKDIKSAIQNGQSLTFENDMDGARKRRIASLYAATQGNYNLFNESENSIM